VVLPDKFFSVLLRENATLHPLLLMMSGSDRLFRKPVVPQNLQNRTLFSRLSQKSLLLNLTSLALVAPQLTFLIVSLAQNKAR
jgi:hypothetical protein